MRFLFLLVISVGIALASEADETLTGSKSGSGFSRRFHQFNDKLTSLNVPDLISTKIEKWTKKILPDIHRNELKDKVKDLYKKEWSAWYQRYFTNFGQPKYQQSFPVKIPTPSSSTALRRIYK